MTAIQASNILIFGATGLIGKYITEKVISAQPAFNHVTIFTSQETVETKRPLLDGWKKAGNVTVVTGSADAEADVRAAYKDHQIDTVICAFGRVAIAKQIDLLRWADADGGVRWFLPSEFGTDVEYGPRSRDEPPHQQKLRVRRFVGGGGGGGGGGGLRRVRVTYVVTGPYFELWVERAPGLPGGASTGFDVGRREALLIGDGEGRIGFTTMPDVGRLVVAALRHPEAAVGRALKVNSFETTPNQVLAEYEKQTGSKWTVEYVPLSKIVEVEKRLVEEQDPKATVVTLRRIWAEGGTLYEKTDNESIGLKAEDMEPLEAVLKRLLAGN